MLGFCSIVSPSAKVEQNQSFSEVEMVVMFGWDKAEIRS